MKDQIETIAHAMYLADLQYDGSGDRYAYLAEAALTSSVASQALRRLGWAPAFRLKLLTRFFDNGRLKGLAILCIPINGLSRVVTYRAEVLRIA